MPTRIPLLRSSQLFRQHGCPFGSRHFTGTIGWSGLAIPLTETECLGDSGAVREDILTPEFKQPASA